VPLNPVAVAVLLRDPQRQLMEKLTGTGRLMEEIHMQILGPEILGA
jgi:hypothetical protein